ncbi:transportin 1 [Pelomyxa schiedti]|nr:transportin 1 [Pelomyxa schiedti]
MVLLVVLGQCKQEPIVVREMAGVALKNHLAKNASKMDPSTQPLMKVGLLKILGDPHVTVRHIAATSVSALISQQGVSAWPHLISELYDLLGSNDTFVVEGTLHTVCLVLEDYSHQFCTVTPHAISLIVPKLTGLMAHNEEIFRASAAKALSTLISSKLFSFTSGVVDVTALIQATFKGMSDHSLDVKIHCCNVFVVLARTLPNVLLPHLGPIFSCIHTLTQDPNEDVVKVSYNFWISVSKQACAAEFFKQFIPMYFPCRNFLVYFFARLLPTVMLHLAYANLDQTLAEFENSSQTLSGGKFSKIYGAQSETEWDRRALSTQLLEILVTFFQDTVKPLLPPLISKLLQPNSPWQIEESGVYSLSLTSRILKTQEPESVLRFLIGVLHSPNAPIRSAACQAVGRYWDYIVDRTKVTSNHDMLAGFLHNILQKMQDPSTKVRHSACISLIQLEEVAGELLRDYARGVVESAALALKSYENHNVYIVYEVIAALASTVRGCMDTPECRTVLMPTLVEKWVTFRDTAEYLLTIIECLHAVAMNFGSSFMPYVPHVFQQCLDLIFRLQTTLSNAPEEEDLLALSKVIDFTTALCECAGKSIDVLLQGSNLVTLLLATAGVTVEEYIFESIFGLSAAVAKCSFSSLLKYIGSLMNLIEIHLKRNCCIKASLALGEMYLNGNDVMQEYSPKIIPLVVASLATAGRDGLLSRNLTCCLCQIGCVSPGIVASKIEPVVPVLCKTLERMDEEDTTRLDSFRILLTLLDTNPAIIVTHFTPLCCALASLITTPGASSLVSHVARIVTFPQQHAPAHWPAMWSAVPTEAKNVLAPLCRL